MRLFACRQRRGPQSQLKNRKVDTGFTLVELLISMVLMGALVLMVTNLVLKSNSVSLSLKTRYEEAIEVQAWVLDLQQELARGVYISNNSSSKRLEYTTFDSSGNAVKKVYGLCYSTANAASTNTGCAVSSGANVVPYLKLSLDGGSTWGSPYRVAPYSKYFFDTSAGQPLFLYSHDSDNCTNFTDTDSNGVWANGTDSAGAYLSCSSYSASPGLNTPNQSTKVILRNFVFAGNSAIAAPAKRALPPSLFVLAPQGPIISTATSVSPAVKDSPLFKSITTNTADMGFGTGFDIRSVEWDPSRERLIAVGNHVGGTAKIFQVDRTGVLIGRGLPILDTSVQLNSVDLLEDGQSVIALDSAAKKVYWYNLSASLPLVPYQVFNLANPSAGIPSLTPTGNLINSPSSLLYDSRYPTEFFLTGIDPADSALKIMEFSSLTGAVATTAISGGKLALPAAFDASHPAGGFSQEPVSGDYLITRNYVNGTAPNKSVDIYRITSGGSSSTFSVNISDLGSTATGTSGYWGLGYSNDSNHLFLTDSVSDRIYEVIPSQLISPRN